MVTQTPCAKFGGRTANIPAGADEDRIEIALISGPIHYDILLPLTEPTLDQFVFLSQNGLSLAHPDARWLLVGWGAREFYTTTGSYRDLSFRAIWRAITGDSAVMRLDVVGKLPAGFDAQYMQLTASQYSALLTAINQDFKPNLDGERVMTESGV